ncbi:hypothetical protein N9955_00985 [bacterium]|nr:hypothetical protein [bacterium]
MKIKNIYGREVSINPTKYLIDWEKVVSKPQKQVKDVIAPYWKGNLVCEEFFIPSSKMRVDIINFSLGIVVEVSPKGSHGYNNFFHKNRPKFLSGVKRDLKKTEWILSNDFEYIEIDDEDLKDNEKILEKIIK